MPIKILLTGGTIDKHYSTSAGKLAFGDSHIPEMLERANVTDAVNVEQLMLKDSLDIEKDERDTILTACKNSSEGRILVTHGTDTMVNTAQLLGDADLDKTIVLTGAMVPYSVTGSDALFNLGYALSSVQQASWGVYIAMNGQLFDWDNVQKNYDKGVFETLGKQ